MLLFISTIVIKRLESRFKRIETNPPSTNSNHIPTSQPYPSDDKNRWNNNNNTDDDDNKYINWNIEEISRRVWVWTRKKAVVVVVVVFLFGVYAHCGKEMREADSTLKTIPFVYICQSTYILFIVIALTVSTKRNNWNCKQILLFLLCCFMFCFVIFICEIICITTCVNSIEYIYIVYIKKIHVHILDYWIVFDHVSFCLWLCC